MINMITDMIRIPVDKYGNMIYDVSEVSQLIKTYQQIYPDHQVFAIPENIKIWEDLDIETLEYMSQCLEKIIQEKKQTND